MQAISTTNKYIVKKANAVPANANGICKPERIDWSLANVGSISEVNWPQFTLDGKTITQRVSPKGSFYLIYNKGNIFCLLTTSGEEEKNPRAEATAFQDPVHLDSCMEFFLAAEMRDRLYLNIETNARGTKHVGCGRGRKEGLSPDTNVRHRLSAEETCGLYMQPAKPAQLSQPGQEAQLNQLANLGQSAQVSQLAQPSQLDFNWGVYIQIPLAFLAQFWPSMLGVPETSTSSFESSKAKLQAFYAGQILKANFYKCGDRCRSPHFLSWCAIQSPQPDFHRPEDFGYLVLE